MKHLQKFQVLSETKSTAPKALSRYFTGPKVPLGFAFRFGDILHYASANTFHDFATFCFETLAYVSPDRYYFDLHYLLQDLTDIEDGSEYAQGLIDGAILWTGLKPRESQGFQANSVNLDNPIIATEFLESSFSNVKQIMKEYPRGNWGGDPTYLSLSIQNDPSSLSRYLDYDSQKPGPDLDENLFKFNDILNKMPKDLREELAKIVRANRASDLI